MKEQKIVKKEKKQVKEVGRWTKQQHSKFIQGLMQYGKNWKKVEQIVGTRTAAQVRSHAQKFFNRLDRQQKKIEEQNSQTQYKQHEQNYNNQHITEQTPQNIVSLIKKESKNDKSVNVNNFINTLKNQSTILAQNIEKKRSSHEEEHQIQNLQKQRQQLHSMSNLVSAFSNLSEEQEKNESFFLSLLKKYKKYICDNKFIELIDVPHQLANQIEKVLEPKQRKRSFHLIQDNDENIQNLNKLRKIIKTQQKIVENVGSKTQETNNNKLQIINIIQEKQ